MAELTNEDRQILSALEDLGASSTNEVARRIGYVGHTASTGWRLRVMLSKGLTSRPSRNQYAITPAGRQALQGEQHDDRN